MLVKRHIYLVRVGDIKMGKWWNEGNLKTKHAKVLFWYIISCILWFLFVGMIPARGEDLIQLCFYFVHLALGLLIGFLGKDILCNKPWLFLLLPILYLMFIIFV